MEIHDIDTRYPVGAFPITARNAIREIARNVKAPVDLVASSVLSAMSAVTQAQVKVSLPIGGQSKPVSLFMLVVAVSGDRKTTVDNLVFRPVRQYDDQLLGEYERAMRRYLCEHRIWSAKGRRLIRQATADENQNEGLAVELESYYDGEPIKPRLRRLVRQNASERATLDALAGSGESFALIADEGGVILRSPLFCNSAFLNKIWDGGPVIFDRASGVSIAAKDTRVTTSIMVQPHVLEDFTHQRSEVLRGSGFFARFLMTWSQSIQGSRFLSNTNLSWPNLEKFHHAIVGFLPEKSANQGLCEVVLELDEDAKKTWVDFVNQVEGDIRPGGYLSEINDFASKVGEIVVRVSAIFHHFSKQEGLISTDTVKRAIDVVCYHVEEFKRAFDPCAQVPRGLLDAQKLQDYLLRHCWMNGCSSIARNDVLRSGPVRGVARFDVALATLCNQSSVWINTGQGKKRFINLNSDFFSRLNIL